MSEVTLTQVEHDGVLYPADTPVEKIKGLSGEQAEKLREVKAIGEPSIPESVKSELEAARAEVEELKALLAEATKTEPKK